MGLVYLCLGKNAEVPYYFERARIHVWNVEELCYFARENAWVLDSSVLNDLLVQWIRQQCSLPDLADALAGTLQKEKPVQNFVHTLFAYTGYCSKQDEAQVEKILNLGENSSEAVRTKALGDHYLQRGKYVMALREYESLTRELTGMDPAFLGKVYHNCGVARARLFWFDSAADCFERAFRLTKSQDSAREYLMAKRFFLGEKEYVNFLSDKPDLYAASLKLEEAVQQCDGAWEESEEAAFLARAAQAAQNGGESVGRQMVKEKTAQLQEEYRSCVEE